jgi:hypothetical protein
MFLLSNEACDRHTRLTWKREGAMRVRIKALVVTCVVAVPGSATGALAQTPDSLVIRSGGLVADFNSNVRLDLTNTQLGTTISLENDLGFTHTTGTWFIDGYWRITPRHRLYGSFVNVNRDSTKAGISQPITIRDQTFHIGPSCMALCISRRTAMKRVLKGGH